MRRRGQVTLFKARLFSRTSQNRSERPRSWSAAPRLLAGQVLEAVPELGPGPSGPRTDRRQARQVLEISSQVQLCTGFPTETGPDNSIRP